MMCGKSIAFCLSFPTENNDRNCFWLWFQDNLEDTFGSGCHTVETHHFWLVNTVPHGNACNPGSDYHPILQSGLSEQLSSRVLYNYNPLFRCSDFVKMALLIKNVKNEF